MPIQRTNTAQHKHRHNNQQGKDKTVLSEKQGIPQKADANHQQKEARTAPGIDAVFAKGAKNRAQQSTQRKIPQRPQKTHQPNGRNDFPNSHLRQCRVRCTAPKPDPHSAQRKQRPKDQRTGHCVAVFFMPHLHHPIQRMQTRSGICAVPLRTLRNEINSLRNL